MKNVLRLAALLVGFAAPAAGPAVSRAEPPSAPVPTPVEMVRRDDPEMNGAIAEAQRTLPEFLRLLANPPPGTGEYVFKYPLAGWEHIWVDHVERRGNALTGALADVPQEPGYRHGQRVTVPLGAVSDWAYRDARGVVQGQRTARVLLPRIDPAIAATVRAAMGWKD